MNREPRMVVPVRILRRRRCRRRRHRRSPLRRSRYCWWRWRCSCRCSRKVRRDWDRRSRTPWTVSTCCPGPSRETRPNADCRWCRKSSDICCTRFPARRFSAGTNETGCELVAECTNNTACVLIRVRVPHTTSTAKTTVFYSKAKYRDEHVISCAGTIRKFAKHLAKTVHRTCKSLSIYRLFLLYTFFAYKSGPAQKCAFLSDQVLHTRSRAYSEHRLPYNRVSKYRYTAVYY